MKELIDNHRSLYEHIIEKLLSAESKILKYKQIDKLALSKYHR